MDAAKGDTTGDVLTCPKCGGKTMLIYIEANEVQSVRCASCSDLVAYTEKLIRILEKPLKPWARGRDATPRALHTIHIFTSPRYLATMALAATPAAGRLS